jgi:hypothetical protein
MLPWKVSLSSATGIYDQALPSELGINVIASIIASLFFRRFRLGKIQGTPLLVGRNLDEMTSIRSPLRVNLASSA